MAYPCAGRNSGRIKLAWITDIHVDPAAAATRATKLASFVTMANSISPHATIISGDMVDDGNDDHATTTDAAAAILAGLNHPYFVVPGNHDLIPNDASKSISYGPVWKQYVLNAYGYATFEQAADVGNARLIMTDTNYSAASYGWVTQGLMRQAQIDWLEAELAATTQDYAIIVGHHPIGTISQYTDYPAHEPDSAFNTTLQAMLDAQPIPKAYVCGHDHPSQLLRGNTPVPIGAATTTIGKFGTTEVIMMINFFASYKWCVLEPGMVNGQLDVAATVMTA